MSAIYERQKTAFAGSFASDVAALAITGQNGLKAALGIVQNAQVQFAQQVARIYDVSNGGNSGSGQQGATVPVFFVGGRTQGQATIGRVLGPQSGALCQFYAVMGNVCSPQDLAFAFEGGCSTTSNSPAILKDKVGSVNKQRVEYVLEDSLMVNLGINVQSTDMIVNESISLMFANMVCNGQAT